MRPRSLFVAALVTVAAFVLGLALGGQIPREATAQAQAPPKAAFKAPGLGWKNDGKNLIITNGAPAPYLVEVRLKKGTPALSPALPTRSNGSVRVPVGNLDSVGIYRLQAVGLCSPSGCRPCDPIPGGDCPIPPRPPFSTQDSLTSVYAKF